jgi:Abnormal spindle-like microcephaly-assoc'd, ASPM-SPD-2-Hydin
MSAPAKHLQFQNGIARRDQVSFFAALLLGMTLLSVSGCSGLTQASSSTAKSSSSNGTTSSSSLSASQTSLSFSNVNLGSTKSLPVVFTNTGSSKVTVANVTISGAGYAASGVQSGQILAPGEAATLSVTFDPAATGTLAGRVTVSSDAANSPANVTLTGTGLQVPVSHSAVLNWSASKSTVASYNVYRSTVSGGPYARLSSVTTTASRDSSVTAGLTYYYVVTSVESSGVESDYSSEVTAVVPRDE